VRFLSARKFRRERRGPATARRAPADVLALPIVTAPAAPRVGPAKLIGRELLRRLCSVGLPGRYVAVELLAPLLVGPDRPLGRTGRALRVRCDLSDQLQRQIYFGLYEPDETPFFRGLLRPGDVFLDVGANVGYYALMAAEICGRGGQVHAFEPIPANCAVLRQNAAINGLTNLTVNQVALTDGQAEQVTLYLRQSGSNSGWASIAPSPRRGNQPLVVPATSLDRYVAERGLGAVALVKLDCEGAESLVLRGARELLSRPDGPDLMCELSPFHLSLLGSSAAELKGLIAERGYALYAIERGGLVPMDPAAEETRQRNVYATKRPLAPGLRVASRA
jgi:FkbM family methyltransferase